MNPIGIMQGRLSPPVARRIQAFPWASWQEEFERAKQIGLDLIEWLFEDEGYEQNPIWNDAGVEAICECSAASGVQVRTCCADYFMPHPFFRVSEAERLESIRVLNRLIEQLAKVGVQLILMPVLEVCEARTQAEKDLLIESLRGPLDLAASHDIRIGLETELPAEEYRALVEQANHPALGVYYDTGNNAARGHDIAADAEVLVERLFGVHVKDRRKGGPTVLLGQGDANFDGFFAVTRQAGFSGPVILQTAFGPDFTGIAAKHLEFVRKRLI